MESWLKINIEISQSTLLQKLCSTHQTQHNKKKLALNPSRNPQLRKTHIDTLQPQKYTQHQGNLQHE